MLKFHVGKDQYLFLENDTNAVWQQVSGNWRPPLADFFDRWIARHVARSLVCAQNNMEYFHIIVPNKETCLLDLADYKYEGELVQIPKGPVFSILDCNFFAKNHIFYNHSVISAPKFFHKTDSHWNFEGALTYTTAAFKAFCDCNAARLLHKAIIGWGDHELHGDLGLHADKEPEICREPIYETGAMLRFSNHTPNEGYIRHYINASAPLRKKVLIFHDSTIHRLYNGLASIFEEVLFIHCPDFDVNFAVEFGAELVYFFQMERFTVRLSSNEASYIDFVHQKESSKGVQPTFADYIRPILGL